MKSKYYPGTDFLNAKLVTNPSYMWRSILAAQTVLKQGCRRSIGTGEDTFIWKVPWLPCIDNGYVTTSMPQVLERAKLVNLLQINGRQWDNDVLLDIFNERDVQLIKKIPLPAVCRLDSWLWLFDSKGVFSVKSCYRKLVGECSTPDKTFWKKFWALEIPAKVKMLVWRSCQSCLPTAVALIEKRVSLASECPWCHMGHEDTMHVFFECDYARQVWEALGMTQWIQVESGGTAFNLFKRLFSAGTKDQCLLLVMACYNLRNRRNHWVWNKVEKSVFDTKQTVMNLLAD